MGARRLTTVTAKISSCPSGDKYSLPRRYLRFFLPAFSQVCLGPMLGFYLTYSTAGPEPGFEGRSESLTIMFLHPCFSELVQVENSPNDTVVLCWFYAQHEAWQLTQQGSSNHIVKVTLPVLYAHMMYSSAPLPPTEPLLIKSPPTLMCFCVWPTSLN